METFSRANSSLSNPTTLSRTFTPVNGCSSFIAPTNITEKNIKEIYWPYLSEFVESALRAELRTERPLYTFSHDELYRTVYWICWADFHALLYKNLISLVESVLAVQEQSLNSISIVNEWFDSYDSLCQNYSKAIQTITTVFAHMDKNYVQPVLKDQLFVILCKLFIRLVVIKSEMRTFYICHIALEDPQKINIGQIRTLLETLYRMDEGTLYLYPTLFQKLVPSSSIPSSDCEIRHDDLQRKIQAEGLNCIGFSGIGGVNTRLKRRIEDDGEREPNVKRRITRC